MGGKHIFFAGFLLYIKKYSPWGHKGDKILVLDINRGNIGGTKWGNMVRKWEENTDKGIVPPTDKVT